MEESQADESVGQSLSRKLRMKLLLDEGQRLEKELPRHNSVTALGTISSLIEKTDSIINEGDFRERADHTTEVVMDTHVLRMNHELISKVLEQNMEFNEHIYQNAIKSIVMKTSVPEWKELTELACQVSRTVNVQSTMLGALESELKTRIVKERQQRKAGKLEAVKRPDNVKKLKRADEGAEKVNVIHRQLAQIFKANKRSAVPFYKLIVDPNNFMNSVENAFQLAFLARDGVIGIDIGMDGHPEVRLVNSSEQKVQIDTSQWICSLDVRKCSEMAKFYKIKEPMLKIGTEVMESDDGEEEDD